VTEDTMEMLGELIVVHPDKPETQKVITPDWTRTLKGTVVSIGPECRELQVGNRVVFGAATGMESVRNNVLTRIMRESDVDAVL
jgi:co-chaperonin GroES (HSP10)